MIRALGGLGVYLLLIALAAVTLLPFAYMLSASLKGNADFFSSLFLPAGDGWLGVAWDRITLTHFRRLTTELGFAGAILNSFFLASVISLLATLCCAMGGYALAKHRFRGRATLGWVILGSLVVPGALLIAPSYQLLYQLGLLDSYAGLILPALAPAFGVHLFRQAARSGVPDELIDAARIDGCGEIRTFFAVALPLVRPMAGAFMLITFVGVWNNFIGPQVVLQTPGKLPLSVAVAQLRGTYQQDYGLLMAGTVVSILPVMLLFLLLQREFITGLTSGAVKG